MAQLGELRRAAFSRVESAQHYQSTLLGLTAASRHEKLVNDYLTYYVRESSLSGKQDAAPTRTDADALREHHRFIHSNEDTEDTSWEARLAKRYYDRLFKEYAIVDLTYYKQSKLGMRWRTQKEVMSGKGQFVCGAKGCEASDGLCSYEVNFTYQEGGERKQALVKIRVCPACAFKLNYRKEKQLQKVVQPSAARKRKHELEVDAWASQDPLVQEALDYVQCYAPGGSHSDVAGDGINGADLERAARDVAPPSAVANAVTTVAPTADAGSAQADGGGSGSGPKGVITLPADNSVWESKPAQEIANVEEEMDAYFEGLFL